MAHAALAGAEVALPTSHTQQVRPQFQQATILLIPLQPATLTTGTGVVVRRTRTDSLVKVCLAGRGVSSTYQ